MRQDTIHYNLDEIDKHNSLINLILGEKSGGKSYQIKHKKAVEYYLKYKKRFILLRRWKDEVTTEKVEQYFSDVDISKLTNSEYNCISVYRRAIYLANYDFENNKVKRGDKIGYAIALSQEQNYSSISFLDVDNIIFEEFMSRTAYIANEPNKLMIFHDTVDRKRGKCKLWLLGNTISRVCPYLSDWDLSATINKMSPGNIVDVAFKQNINMTLSVEYCKQTNQKSFAIGTSASMISGGKWLSDKQPHLDFSIKSYKPILRIVFVYYDFKFLATLLSKKNTLVWFICPKKTEVKKNTIVIGQVNESPLYSKNIYNLDYRINEKIRNLISKTFTESNIFYSTDLCGTDFKQCVDFLIKK